MRLIIKRVMPAKLKLGLARLRNRYYPIAALAPTAAGPAPASPYQFWTSVENPLCELAETMRPTKRFHNYLVYYHLHFQDVRHEVRAVLEIGLETDRSLRMWEAYFPKAMVYGIDIDPRCKDFEGPRRRVFIGDQGDPAFLRDCLRQIGVPLDIVIDDGSHHIHHQVASFNYLFPQLSSHGIYVIEDTGGCVGDFRLRTVNRLKTLIDSIFYWPPDRKDRDWTTLAQFPENAPWAAKNISGIAFYRWIVFVMRGRNPEDNPYLPVTEKWYDE